MSEKKYPEWPTKWAGKTWSGGTGRARVTEGDLRRVYDAVVEFPAQDWALVLAAGVTFRTNDRCNKMLQLLRKAGLIYYVRGHWWPKVVSDGR